MAMHVRLSGEEVALHPLSYREVRRLLAGLPGRRWDLALSSTTRWTPDHSAGEKPETAGPSPSSSHWFRIETSRSPMRNAAVDNSTWRHSTTQVPNLPVCHLAREIAPCSPSPC